MFQICMVLVVAFIINGAAEILFEKLNESENLQVEAPKAKNDRFVLIGHSDQLQIQHPEAKSAKSDQEHKLRQKNYYQNKGYYSKDEFNKYNTYNTYLEQESDDVGTSSNVNHRQNMTSYNYPRSGVYLNSIGGNSNSNRYNYNGNGYSAGGGGSLLGSGFLGSGLLGLHLLDPLILLATLSFVLFLINSVITLVERLRIPFGHGHGGIGRRADPARRLLIDQELIVEMGQYFNELILDYEIKLKNETETSY